MGMSDRDLQAMETNVRNLMKRVDALERTCSSAASKGTGDDTAKRLEKRVIELERRSDADRPTLQKFMDMAALRIVKDEKSGDVLDRRVKELERRSDADRLVIQKFMDTAASRVVGGEKASDQLDAKISALRKQVDELAKSSGKAGPEVEKTAARLDGVVKQLNERLITAKAYDDRLDAKIADLRKQVDSIKR